MIPGHTPNLQASTSFSDENDSMIPSPQMSKTTKKKRSPEMGKYFSGNPSDKLATRSSNKWLFAMLLLTFISQLFPAKHHANLKI